MSSQDLSRYFHTLRHLRAGQVVARLRRRWQSREVDQSPVGPRRARSGVFESPIPAVDSLVAPSLFRFLNLEQRCASKEDWQGSPADRLWHYNLHYFDYLNSRHGLGRIDWHIDLLDRWQRENPPGDGIGWEPYPVARRIVNWIKFDLRTGGLTGDALHNLAIQARWLERRLEFHLLGNHLFADAKALVFAGLFFEGEEADRWCRRGMSLVSEQLAEQVLADGGHFELSPMYHAAFLEDLLDLVNLLRSSGVDVPAEWTTVCGRMRAWLAAMVHPDGEIPFFNDAAFGVAPRAAELEAYAARLSLPLIYPPAELTDLVDSGYVRASAGPAFLICDCADIGPDYLPGHAHADTLSFELSLFGQRVFVNGGTSTYTEGPERQRQRGTAAHNTVVLDGQDSSEVWGGFRVARRARILDREVHAAAARVDIFATHDGYRRLAGRNLHSRRWYLAMDGLVIDDEVSGGPCDAEARFHLHPSVAAVKLPGPGVALDLAGVDENQLRMEFTGAEAVTVESFNWQPEFGLPVPSRCVVARFARDTLRTVLSWPANY